MNLKLNVDRFQDNLVKTKPLFDGVQYLFRFPNDFGASVVKHFGSYGSCADLWELAVVRYIGDEDWKLEYGTEITNDVLGFLSNAEVLDTLQQIKDLKSETFKD